MRDCPECGDPLALDPVRCLACGYRPGKKTGSAADNPDAMRCDWVAGERCHYAGVLSPNTTGGGPWYCTGHFGCDDAAHGQRIVDESRRNVKTHRLTGIAMQDVARKAFLARPLPPVPPVPTGVKMPPRDSGAFTRIGDLIARHSRRFAREEADAERMAIQSEGARPACSPWQSPTA